MGRWLIGQNSHTRAARTYRVSRRIKTAPAQPQPIEPEEESAEPAWRLVYPLPVDAGSVSATAS